MALKQKRPHPRAVDFESTIFMHDNMVCPQGHVHVVLSGGVDKGRKYLEARCREPGCGLHQRVYAEERDD